MGEISTEVVYKTNQEFRGYVDRFARERHVLISDALTYKTVEEVAKYYLEKSHGKDV